MDYVQKNANHFSEEHAALYDNEGTFAIGKGIAWNILTYGNELLKPAESKDTVNPIWKNARVLDFACGTGIVSQNIAPHVKEVVGVDIAPEMISIFDHKAETNGPTNAKGYLVNIFEDAEVKKYQSSVPGGLDDFDLAVASLAYHHIDDIDMASSALYRRLKPNGWAFVADLAQNIKEENQPVNKVVDPEIVPHPTGFTPAELAASFKQAGFVNVSSNHSFTLELWVTGSFIDRFAKHHVVSRDDDPPSCNSFPERDGVRIYDSKIVDGETYYMFKMKLHLVVGQRV